MAEVMEHCQFLHYDRVELEGKTPQELVYQQKRNIFDGLVAKGGSIVAEKAADQFRLDFFGATASFG